ncbi:hypothetical protein [Paenibacillus alvei]|uniref:hypothetical protein n=1 Tax=Paenibacillus alvei TaxID=44250 RepID=UPI00227F9C71|nr:hypothetical protein [Paenibacillus alvei]
MNRTFFSHGSIGAHLVECVLALMAAVSTLYCLLMMRAVDSSGLVKVNEMNICLYKA